jgi:hypothetical protein
VLRTGPDQVLEVRGVDQARLDQRRSFAVDAPVGSDRSRGQSRTALVSIPSSARDPLLRRRTTQSCERRGMYNYFLIWQVALTAIIAGIVDLFAATSASVALRQSTRHVSSGSISDRSGPGQSRDSKLFVLVPQSRTQRRGLQTVLSTAARRIHDRSRTGTLFELQILCTCLNVACLGAGWSQTTAILRKTREINRRTQRDLFVR